MMPTATKAAMMMAQLTASILSLSRQGNITDSRAPPVNLILQACHALRTELEWRSLVATPSEWGIARADAPRGVAIDLSTIAPTSRVEIGEFLRFPVSFPANRKQARHAILGPADRSSTHVAMIAAIRRPARPSPNGNAGRAIARRSNGFSKSRRTSDTIRSVEVPTRRALRLSTHSGRSVFSRKTRSGAPRAAASSCMPPESLSIISASRMRPISSAWLQGAISEMPRVESSSWRIVAATCGFG